MTTVNLKRDDRLPKLRARLTDSDGAALNLSGATVTFRMRRTRSDDELKVDADATVIDAADGVVEYAWEDGDTDTEGYFDAEFAVAIADLVETVPSSGFVLVVIGRRLGD